MTTNADLGRLSASQMVALRECIRKAEEVKAVRTAIQVQVQTIEHIIEKNAIADLSVLYAVENCIDDKNRKIDKQLRELQKARYQPFQSQKTEFIRKSDINALMPDISNEDTQQVSKFAEFSPFYGGDLRDFLPIINASTAEVGTKMIEEMLVMTSFLMVHGKGQYSRNWRRLQDEKLEELRPLIVAGKNTIETREAMQYLHYNYYRMRAAYVRVKKNLETRQQSVHRGVNGEA